MIWEKNRRSCDDAHERAANWPTSNSSHRVLSLLLTIMFLIMLIAFGAMPASSGDGEVVRYAGQNRCGERKILITMFSMYIGVWCVVGRLAIYFTLIISFDVYNFFC